MRHVALTLISLSLMALVFGGLCYGAVSGNLVPFIVISVAELIGMTLFAWYAPDNWPD